MLSTRGYSLLCLEFRRDHQAQQPCQPWCLQQHLLRRMLVALLKFFRHRNQLRLLLHNRRVLQTSKTDHQFQLFPSVSHLFSPFTPNIQHPSTFRPNAPPIISNPQKTTPENPSNTKTHRRNNSLYTPFENQNPVVVIPQSLQIPRRAVFYSSLSNRSSSDESFSSLISTEEML